ncbi:hypothetical protein M404DRAFT_1003267 [Pisolithus tinctorius Marx 270]|uniref:Uncharacterized protein n=1 Tax=Pisolithus tinctorius Marx 270 TaxID=870435 RepID=A0A0C3IWM7_PISTI|nr:hypothetical protein M404DRAFT_1006032 [Pisolithus tinctorius Marx 270]KIO01238.1 hypothetical protein M404DRAFT_1003267 [Pisolithus tinctorius Marx 270]
MGHLHTDLPTPRPIITGYFGKPTFRGPQNHWTMDSDAALVQLRISIGPRPSRSPKFRVKPRPASFHRGAAFFSTVWLKNHTPWTD